MSRFQRLTALAMQMALVMSFAFSGFAADNNGRDHIKSEDLKEWLGYLASDELEGRSTFTEGLGLAAAYIAFNLKSWGVKPGGPNGSYFQRVPVLDVKSENRSTVTVEVNGQSRTFKNGEGIRFPSNVGSKRAFTSDQIEFMGYGLIAPGHNDYAGKNVKGKIAVWLGPRGPKGIEARRLLGSRSRTATSQEGAIASIGPETGGGNRNRGGGNNQAGGRAERPDFVTVQRLDAPLDPAVSASDEFFEFLFSGSDVKYAELKAASTEGNPLSHFALKNVRITFNLDADYTVTRTQYTRNVIGVIEGSDPRLKDTYVAYGAHYDHVGYAEGEVADSRRAGARGRVTAGALEDRIWNGADDDGSGTVAIMAVAKAFALGPKPRRSLIFVWHAGEERGLWGSRYYADYPTVPIDKIVAEINLDMVGRNRDNKPEESNTVYAVGSDRISTEFHNITVDANDALKTPLKVDYALNDPSDQEQIYYRSDHYSYAAKGIPIIFLTTFLHPDYHANTDSVEKIEYEKMTKISQYAYEIGARTANLGHAPARDNRGPRIGIGGSGKLKM